MLHWPAASCDRIKEWSLAQQGMSRSKSGALVCAVLCSVEVTLRGGKACKWKGMGALGSEGWGE
jgi:hypothetical protein